ncbi:uncharacterized protein K441DRAFT_667668 [Cenococcum geophilum 1.58]|uniref:uncharacterized protein n=1 Tax=Cenococcum geophilum 1.58 TaxID=794803 RepID=UPI00358E01B7|nr:hypothetical protein K441DRAFT_667668 [Cenococcum geophilum 1.58]
MGLDFEQILSLSAKQQSCVRDTDPRGHALVPLSHVRMYSSMHILNTAFIHQVAPPTISITPLPIAQPSQKYSITTHPLLDNSHLNPNSRYRWDALGNPDLCLGYPQCSSQSQLHSPSWICHRSQHFPSCGNGGRHAGRLFVATLQRQQQLQGNLVVCQIYVPYGNVHRGTVSYRI